MPTSNGNGIHKDVLVWSTSDLSAAPTLGSSFTVTGTPDLMSFKDDEGVIQPGDFDPGDPNTIEPNQTLSGTLEGQEFTGNHGTTDVFEFEVAFQVTDGVNTFNVYQIDNDVYGGTTTAYVSEFVLEPGTTYTVVAQDNSVNFADGGYEATPSWTDLAGQVDGTSGDDTIGAGFVDDDDDRVDGNDGNNDVIVGEGGGDTINAGAGDDLVYGDHVDDLPPGTNEYVVQGFVRDLNFELESGSLRIGGSQVSVSGTPIEIRFIDNDSGIGDDDVVNDVPTDSDQLVEINGVLYNFSPDFYTTYNGSDGQTYTMMVVDVDRNGVNGIDNYSPSSDPGDVDYEHGQILIPVGAVPPPGVTLTASGTGGTVSNPDYTTLNGGTLITNYDDSIDAGVGDDTVFGGRGADIINGGDGNDTIYGDGGEAFVFNTQAGDLFLYDPVSGTSTQLTSGLLTYGDIATTPDGTLYGVVLDANDGGTNAAIYEIDPLTGTETLVYDLPDNFEWFNGFAADDDGNLYYTDSDSLTVTRIEPNGAGGFTNPTIVYSYSGGIVEMTDIAFLQDGTVLVITDPADVKSFDLDGSGNFINETSLGPISGAADLTGIIQGPDGLVYATDINGAVYSTDPSSLPLSWTTEAGTGQANVYGVAAVPSGVGSAGNDTIDGGTGNDTIVAGEGSDTILLSDSFGDDTIFGGEDPDGLDIDRIDASGITTGGVTVNVTNESGSVTQGADSADFSDIESFTLTDQNDTFSAFGTDDVTVDGGAGDDTFQEGNGNNTMFGGAGNDTFEVGYGTSSIDGGTGTDTLSAAASNDPISVTFNGTGSGTYDDLSDSDSGTFSNIESVQGSGRNDSINAAADSGGVTLAGGAGDDTITGGSGDDIITGDAGADTISGGAGSDSLDGGDGRDRVVFDGNHDDYTYDIIGPGQITVTHIATGDVDTVTGFEEIQFADGLFDLVIGTDGDDTLVHDGAGIGQDNDFMVGGDGSDVFNSGSGNDVLIAGVGNDSFDAGTGNDTVYAGAGEDTVDAGDGTDIVYGGDGNDILDGGAGNDTVFGGIGSDTILLNNGYLGDSIVGGEDPDSLDVDILDMSGITNDGVDISLSGNESGAVSSTEGTANFIQIESFSLTDQDDTFNGGAATSSMTVDGGAGNDSIAGGSGNDTLDGGAGADTLTGGAGADVFVAGGDADIITDFDTTTGIDGGTSADNDFVDLTSYYNQANLDAWNLANPGQTYTTPLGWLRADQADGTLGEAGNLVIARDSTAVAPSELNAENTGVVCFASGTLIQVPGGQVPVEMLRRGDLVQTRDNGVKPILWIGRRVLGQTELAATPSLRPIRLAAGHFGLSRDLILSPQHGVLLRAPELANEEILWRARHLADMQGGAAREMKGCRRVTYFHILFDQHELVFSNGLVSESLYPGPMAYQSLSSTAQTELATLFPDLTTQPTARAFGPIARDYSKSRILPPHLNVLQPTL